jgi:hypothetical protein
MLADVSVLVGVAMVVILVAVGVRTTVAGIRPHDCV